MGTADLAATEQKMSSALEAMDRDFQKLRVGGASASLVDAIQGWGTSGGGPSLARAPL